MAAIFNSCLSVLCCGWPELVRPDLDVTVQDGSQACEVLNSNDTAELRDLALVLPFSG